MMEPENDPEAGNPADPRDAALDAELRRWAEDVAPLPAPPYGFERVLVRAHRRKARRRMTAAAATLAGAALVFGGLIAGGVLPGLSVDGANCPSATSQLDSVKGSPVNRRTEYAIGGVLAAGALTAGVVAGCTGNPGSAPSASSGTAQTASPTATAASSNPLTLPSVSATTVSTVPTVPSTASTTGSAIPQCTTADLSPAVTLVAGSQGAGGASLNITLTNNSSHACTVYGFPGLALEDKNEDKQPTQVTWDPAVAKTTIKLAVGASASSTARFDADVPGSGEPTAGPCEASSVYMLVTAPNNETQLVAKIGGTNGAGITVCQSGALDVFALVSGTTGPRQ